MMSPNIATAKEVAREILLKEFRREALSPKGGSELYRLELRLRVLKFNTTMVTLSLPPRGSVGSLAVQVGDGTSDRVVRVPILESAIDPEKISLLLRLARGGDRDAQQVAKELFFETIERGERPNSLLLDYVREVLEGVSKGRRGRNSNHQLWRDRYIAMAVREVADTCGLKRTRNEATTTPCACSVVADVLREDLGLEKMTYKNVARIDARFP
jgi:hypothetical protein